MLLNVKWGMFMARQDKEERKVESSSVFYF